MKININRIKVKFNNKVVGYIEEINNHCIFEYDQQWIKDGFSISPFILPLVNQTLECQHSTFNGLFGVFNDSLPDGWGVLLVMRMLLEKHIDYNKISNLTKLTLISSNGLGGLEYEPCQYKEHKGLTHNDLDEISNGVEKVLNDDYSSKTLDEIYELGGSSGGARPKAHIKIDDIDWIIKFPTHNDKKDCGLQEFKANELAKQCDINVAEFKLFKSNKCLGYFGSKRFDKENGKRLHVISLSGLLEVNHRDFNLDYSTIFSVIKNISPRVKQDIIEAYKRMCFNIFYDNRDDHAKNWSFIYDEKLKGYVLSPFYDITKTPNQYRSLLVFGKEKPTEQDLLNDAKIIGINLKTASDIINKIKKVLETNN